MNYFKQKIKQTPVFNEEGTTKWLLDEAYTLKKKQLKKSFTKLEYNKNPSKFHGFQWLKNQFECANPDCKNEKVECIWYLFQPIDMRVDETFAEFYCPNCKKFTFVEYYRDDS